MFSSDFCNFDIGRRAVNVDCVFIEVWIIGGAVYCLDFRIELNAVHSCNPNVTIGCRDGRVVVTVHISSMGYYGNVILGNHSLRKLNVSCRIDINVSLLASIVVGCNLAIQHDVARGISNQADASLDVDIRIGLLLNASSLDKNIEIVGCYIGVILQYDMRSGIDFNRSFACIRCVIVIIGRKCLCDINRSLF